MDRGDWIRRFAAVRKLNSGYYYYRSNRWRWDPRFRGDDPSIPIDRPFFLLGTQGGGLTLLARILSRIPNVVSVTGDASYWAGYHEMQNVLADVLPEPLTWRKVRIPGFDSDDHNWLYACDAFLPYYRGRASDATEELEHSFKRIVRGAIRLNRPRGASGPVRFLDKSQSYTVRVGLVAELLRDCQPKFVLVVRNPFAMCWRAVTGDRILSALRKSDEEKLAIAVQHWRNSMQCALDDARSAALAWWRFEDFLREPDRRVREICEFAELPWCPEIMPGPDDAIPWGSMFDAFDRHKWYPLRAVVNRAHLETIPGWAVDYVAAECRTLMDHFGYERPR